MRVGSSRCILFCLALGLGLALCGCSGGGGTSTPTTPTTTRVMGITGTLTFGNVAVGQAVVLPLTVTNSGNDAITISAIRINYSASPTGAAAFTPALPGATIPAGGSILIFVTFKPTAVGVHDGVLVIDGNQTGGTDRCAVSGTGIVTASVMAR